MASPKPPSALTIQSCGTPSDTDPRHGTSCRPASSAAARRSTRRQSSSGSGAQNSYKKPTPTASPSTSASTTSTSSRAARAGSRPTASRRRSQSKGTATGSGSWPRATRSWCASGAGGVYEHDALLDACDELGVLVWHDFQFACASYPAYPSFLAALEVEFRQQIRRLRSHPAVVVWAGNNEDYQVQERYKLDYDFADKDPESWLKSTFPARYIYEHLLVRLVKEEDPYMIYHPSSPWGDGRPTADPTVGDLHQWNRKPLFSSSKAHYHILTSRSLARRHEQVPGGA